MIEFILSAPFVLSAIIIIAVIMAVLLEFEKEGWTTILFSLGIALSLWVYKSEIWNFISTSPLSTLLFSLSYIVAGLVWSLFKWEVYIRNRVDVYESLKSEFLREKEIKNNWNDWIYCLNGHMGGHFRDEYSPVQVADIIIPKANEKKSLIVSWISYWPMSLGATLLNNPFRKFFEWIYGMVSGIYDKIGSSAVTRISSGLEKDEIQPDKFQPDKSKKNLLKG